MTIYTCELCQQTISLEMTNIVIEFKNVINI